MYVQYDMIVFLCFDSHPAKIRVPQSAIPRNFLGSEIARSSTAAVVQRLRINDSRTVLIYCSLPLPTVLYVLGRHRDRRKDECRTATTNLAHGHTYMQE